MEIRPDSRSLVLHRILGGQTANLVDSQGTVSLLTHCIKSAEVPFDWGGESLGSLELAYATLSEFGDDILADLMYHDFCKEVIAIVPFAGGTLSRDDVFSWVVDNPRWTAYMEEHGI